MSSAVWSRRSSRERIARSVVVENVAGGGGAIGAAKVAKATADGIVLLMGTVATHAINPLSTPPSPYDAQQATSRPISLIATVPNVLLVNSSVKAKNVRELIALLKSQPGKFTYGSSGRGHAPAPVGRAVQVHGRAWTSATFPTRAAARP